MIHTFLKHVEERMQENKFPLKSCAVLSRFYFSYYEAIKTNGHNIEEYLPILDTFLKLVTEEVAHSFTFEPYHRAIRTPFDYYRFGLDFLRPLVIFEKSRVMNLHVADRICEQLALGENVIFFANHQTEPDPQAISLLLENTHPKLAEEMIFVAGDRVISDPLAIPFSKGRNLLCIYSKKHIENPPQEKHAKQLRNQRTMKLMCSLLDAGGVSIYVAPSGGRDRLNAQNVPEVAPFDPQSIEMFRLMARQASKPTHFYPLTLATYNLLPPPESIEHELGEGRHTRCTPLYMTFGDEIAMDDFPGSDKSTKKEKRQARADYIRNIVSTNFHEILKSQK